MFGRVLSGAPARRVLRALAYHSSHAVAAILLIGDFIGYWTHRLFHGRVLWRFHAVHHRSTQVDWLSAVRLHPVNDAGAKVAQSLPLLFMGFDYHTSQDEGLDKNFAGWLPMWDLYPFRRTRTAA